mmetsp:Transcript_46660/g.135839  ORF Transcript_46660/g.135839 Transcript_46660/m.135839 type:complete len:300 (-) Transcript_46660:134-1033(-)
MPYSTPMFNRPPPVATLGMVSMATCGAVGSRAQCVTQGKLPATGTGVTSALLGKQTCANTNPDGAETRSCKSRPTSGDPRVMLSRTTLSSEGKAVTKGWSEVRPPSRKAPRKGKPGQLPSLVYKGCSSGSSNITLHKFTFGSSNGLSTARVSENGAPIGDPVSNVINKASSDKPAITGIGRSATGLTTCCKGKKPVPAESRAQSAPLRAAAGRFDVNEKPSGGWMSSLWPSIGSVLFRPESLSATAFETWPYQGASAVQDSCQMSSGPRPSKNSGVQIRTGSTSRCPVTTKPTTSSDWS